MLGPAAAPKRRWGRRHGEAGAAAPGWLPTKERFIDPSTQRVMRVWVDPADHTRHYVAEPRSPLGRARALCGGATSRTTGTT